MGDKLNVAVVTPSRQVAEAVVDQVVAPSVCGQITILPNHAPLLADLSAGVIELRGANRADQIFITGGFVEVERDRVVVLAETAEAVAEIDVSRAQADLHAAEAKLTGLDAASADYTAEVSRAERARQRLKAARPA